MGIHMRPNFDSHTITRCKYLLQIAYDLEEEGINPEAIMRMAVFISVVFAYNAGIDPEEYVAIIKDTWLRMSMSLDEDPTEDMTEEINAWVAANPITDQDQ